MNEVPENVPDSVRKQHEAAMARKAEIEQRRTDAAADTATAAASASTAEQAPPAAATPQAAPAAEGPKPTERTSDTPAAQSVEPLQQQISQLEQEKVDLRRQLDSANGRYGGTVQSLKSQIFDLTQQLETKQVAAPAPTAQPASAGAAPSGVEAQPAPAGAEERPSHLKYVSKDDMDRFGEGFPELVANIARGLDDEQAEIQATELAKLSDKTSKTVGDFQTRIELDKFWSEAEQLAPGARAVNGDDEQHIPCEDGWGTFLDEPVRPGSPLTRRREATEAVALRDAVAFAALVREFQDARSGLTEQHGHSRPTVEAQAVPQSLVGDPPPEPAADDTAGRQIPESEINDFKQRAGKGDMSIEDAEERMKEYTAAYQERRVLVGA